MPCPSLNEVEVAWRKAGRGVCVIVEGETEQDDAWFYNQWFGFMARDVSFFPQNGCDRVADAVASLRQNLGPRAVYGIVDRDFETQAAYQTCPPDGILRTRKYTLENYLLEPQCWFDCTQPFTRRNPRAGWNSAAEVQAIIESLYRECIQLSAYNWTLREARTLDAAAFAHLAASDQKYLEHPRAMGSQPQVLARLAGIQAQMGIAGDLATEFNQRVVALAAMPLASLEEVVSGKYVHKLLHEQFPLHLSGRQAWDDVLGAYMAICPGPPVDLTRLVGLIIREARP